MRNPPDDDDRTLKACFWVFLFLGTVIYWLLFSMELAGSAADALLPLLLCEPDLYQVQRG